jgi:hypothetical protein
MKEHLILTMILGQRLQNIESFIVYFDANSTLTHMNTNRL